MPSVRLFPERRGAFPGRLVAVAIPERLGARDEAVGHQLVTETAIATTEIEIVTDAGIKILLRLR